LWEDWRNGRLISRFEFEGTRFSSIIVSHRNVLAGSSRRICRLHPADEIKYAVIRVDPDEASSAAKEIG
jgi:hypothetical protein